jgi:hypothetical protein
LSSWKRCSTSPASGCVSFSTTKPAEVKGQAHPQLQGQAGSGAARASPQRRRPPPSTPPRPAPCRGAAGCGRFAGGLWAARTRRRGADGLEALAGREGDEAALGGRHAGRVVHCKAVAAAAHDINLEGKHADGEAGVP